MHAQRIDSLSLGSAAALRLAPCGARARFAAYAGPLRDGQVAPVGSNPVAQDRTRSANSIARDDPAVVRARPKGQREHVSSHPFAGRRQSITRHCGSGSAAAPAARGRGTALVCQYELDLRSRSHWPTAVCARWSIHSFHPSTVGKMAGRQHGRIRRASRMCLTRAVMRTQVNSHV